jgi:hypothetical protein
MAPAGPYEGKNESPPGWYATSVPSLSRDRSGTRVSQAAHQLQPVLGIANHPDVLADPVVLSSVPVAMARAAAAVRDRRRYKRW